MQQQFNFQETDKKIRATIDNETRELSVYEIEKKIINIICEDSINTTLKTPIDINMFIGYLVDENSFDDNTVTIQGQEYSTELSGIVNIKIMDTSKQITYLQQKTTFTNGVIKTKIYQSLPLGQYVCCIEYAGNKYYTQSKLDINFIISRRKIKCIFNTDNFSVYPKEVFNIDVTLVDELNNKKIKNCIINYHFDDFKYIAQTNDDGYASLIIVAPKINIECLNSEITPTYPLVISVDSEIYELPENTHIDILLKKYNTETTYTLSNDDYTIHVEGDVVAYDNEEDMVNVDYGQVDFYIEQLSSVPYTTQNVDENGHFDFDVIVNDTENANIDPSEPLLYSNPLKTITEIFILDDDEEVTRNYRIGQQISFKAHVTTDNKENVQASMVTFFITQGINEVYRYITELDENGEAFFNFDVSTIGEYQIQAKYHAMFEYQASESKKETYKVKGE